MRTDLDDPAIDSRSAPAVATFVKCRPIPTHPEINMSFDLGAKDIAEPDSNW